MAQEIKQIWKITSPKDNLEYKLEKITEKNILNIGKIKINANYIVSIRNKKEENSPYYKIFLDENKEPFELVLKIMGGKYSFTTPNEVQERYGSFINKAHEILPRKNIKSYEINPIMNEVEYLN